MKSAPGTDEKVKGLGEEEGGGGKEKLAFNDLTNYFMIYCLYSLDLF